MSVPTFRTFVSINFTLVNTAVLKDKMLPQNIVIYDGIYHSGSGLQNRMETAKTVKLHLSISASKSK